MIAALFRACVVAAALALAQEPPPRVSATITVTVVRSGQPLPGTAIEMLRDGEPVAKSTTGSDGTARIEGLAPGEYRVRPGSKFLAFDPPSVKVGARGDGAARLEAIPAGSLGGLVLAPDGSGAAAAEVVALRADREERATADAEGRFEIPSLPPGDYEIRARRAAEASLGGTCDVVADRETRLDPLPLKPAATLVVRVTDAADRPLSGAWVECALYSSATERACFGHERAWSGPDGTARLEPLPAGRHDLVVRHPRCRPSAVETIELAERATVERSVRLDAGASVAGLVVDEDGLAVEGARVFEAGVEMPPSAFAGADGAFVLSGLPDGPVDVGAEAEGRVDARAARVEAGASDVTIVLEGRGSRVEGRVSGLDGSDGEAVVTAIRYRSDPDAEPGWAYADPVTTRAGHFAFENLPPGLYRLVAESAADSDSCGASAPFTSAPGVRVDDAAIAIVRPRALLVRVVDAVTGAPVAGAFVGRSDVARHDSQDLAFALDELASEEEPWVTDGTGRVAISWLGTTRSIVAAHDLYVATAFAPPASGVEQATAPLQKGGAVEGTVRDDLGRPMPGRFVVPMIDGRACRVTIAGADGSYRVDGLPFGAIEIGIAPPVVDPESDPAEVAVDVRTVAVGGARAARADFGGKDAGRVAGTVAADGVPCEGAAVALAPIPGRFEFESPARRTRALPDGTFEMTGVAPGAYVLSAELDGRRARRDVTVAGTGSGGTTRADLEPKEGGLRIRVRDRATGEPVAGAHVAAAEASGESVTIATKAVGGLAWGDTDAEGTVDLAVPPARFVLEVLARRGQAPYAAASATAVVGESGWASVDVALDPGFEVDGAVRDEEGNPVPAPLVTYADASAPPPRLESEADSFADGRFILTNLKPGAYALTVWADGFAPRSGVAFRAERGAQPGPVVTLGRGGSAHVRVVTRDGEPVANAVVYLEGPKGTGFSTIVPKWTDSERVLALLPRLVTDDEGQVRIDLLEPGEYAFEVARDGVRGRVSAVVRADDVTEVEIVPR